MAAIATPDPLPELGPLSTEPTVTEVDGIALDEVTDRTVVHLDADAVLAQASAGDDPTRLAAALTARAEVDEATRVTDDVYSLTGVLAAEPDVRGQLSSTEPYVEHQRHLENVGQVVGGQEGAAGADVTWPPAVEHATGDGVVVAVIDSAIDVDHPELSDRIWTNPGETCDASGDDDGNGYVDDCQGWDFVNDGPDVTSDDPTHMQHGTHVGGTIAAALDGQGVAGVAPDVEIMPLQVAESGSFPMSRVVSAIDYAVDNGADIITASLGSVPGAPAPTALTDAIGRASDAGVLVVTAAGNHGVDIDEEPVWPASYDTPNVVAVAATDNRDDLASFSNRGEASVDLAAPGNGHPRDAARRRPRVRLGDLDGGAGGRRHRRAGARDRPRRPAGRAEGRRRRRGHAPGPAVRCGVVGVAGVRARRPGAAGAGLRRPRCGRSRLP